MISKKHLFFKAKLRLKHENSLFKIAKNIFSGLPVVIFFCYPSDGNKLAQITSETKINFHLFQLWFFLLRGTVHKN